MTAKKDLKKAKSKKKPNKALQRERKAVQNPEKAAAAKAANRESMDTVVRKNKNIMILSIMQSILVLIISLAMLFAKPTSSIGKAMAAQNGYLMSHILTAPVVKGLEIFIGVVAVLYIIKAVRHRQLRKYFVSEALISILALIICMTSGPKDFHLYGLMVLTAFIIVAIEIPKLVFINSVQREYTLHSTVEKNTDTEK